MRVGLDAATLAEKLRPPRALTVVEGALLAEPAAGSTTAWLAWWSGAPASLAAVIARARAAGASRLTFGGPPGNYVESGVNADDTERVAALITAGFTPGEAHLDLRVSTRVASVGTSGVIVRRCGEDLSDAVDAAFGAGWAWEVARARAHGGVYVARENDGKLLGFAAHSGNLAHRGTFGPVGVLPGARGRGVGAALSRAVFVDLRTRGFDEALVPWVATGTVGFYESLVTILGRTRRLALTLNLTGRGSP